MSELRRSAERALDSGTAISLGLIAFLAVFREGGETILMLHAAATQQRRLELRRRAVSSPLRRASARSST